MRNWKDILFKILWSLLAVALVVLFVFAWKSKTEKKCSGIDVELVGDNQTALFMDENQVLSILKSKQIIVGTAISSIPLGNLEKEFKQIVWIKNANFFVDNQYRLHVKIEQRNPIARIFTNSGNSFYMDNDGVRLPLKQLSVLTLPVFTGFTSDADKLSIPDSALLNEVLVFSRVIQQDSFFNAQIAQININPSGQFELIPSVGDHVVLLGSTEHLKDKLNRLITFYKKVLVPSGINAYQYIDCRFDNQVVALKKGMEPIEFGSTTINLTSSVAISDSLHGPSSIHIITAKDSIITDTLKKTSPPVKTISTKENKPLDNNKAQSNVPKKIDPQKSKKISHSKDNKKIKQSLHIQKKSAKAIMPKTGASKTTTNN